MSDKPTDDDDVVKPSEEAEKVVDFRVYKAKLTPLDELVNRSKTDKGAPFEADSIKLLAEARKNNRPAYERALVALKQEFIRISEIEKLLAPKRQADGTEKPEVVRSGRKVDIAETDPWPDPVDGAALLSELAAQIRRYVVLNDNDVVAISLWIPHAHGIACAEHSPRLNFRSAIRRCGKTTALKTIEPTVPKALRTENVSVAAVFRVVEASRPTLLIDEADNFGDLDDNLRKLVNAGFEASGGVLRTVEVNGDFEVRQFAFCPTVLSGIGDLPPTIEDRSIVINLQRRTRAEKVERLRRDRVKHLKELGRQAARWIKDNEQALTEADPALPDELGDREQDKWRPLIAIADLAGGTWPAMARQAALDLSGDDIEDDTLVLLLSDIRDVFGDAYAIHTCDILGKLKAMEERPWSTWGSRRKTPGLNEYDLRSQLKPLRLRPRNIRLGPVQRKGYYYSDLQDAFARYLPVHPPQNAVSSVPSAPSFEINDLDAISSVPANHGNGASVPEQDVDNVDEKDTGTDGTDESEESEGWTEKEGNVRDLGEFDD